MDISNLDTNVMKKYNASINYGIGLRHIVNLGVEVSKKEHNSKSFSDETISKFTKYFFESDFIKHIGFDKSESKKYDHIINCIDYKGVDMDQNFEEQVLNIDQNKLRISFYDIVISYNRLEFNYEITHINKKFYSDRDTYFYNFEIIAGYELYEYETYFLLLNSSDKYKHYLRDLKLRKI